MDIKYIGMEPRTSMRQRPDDGIQNLIEALANIFAQKPQHMISCRSSKTDRGTAAALTVARQS